MQAQDAWGTQGGKSAGVDFTSFASWSKGGGAVSQRISGRRSHSPGSEHPSRAPQLLVGMTLLAHKLVGTCI